MSQGKTEKVTETLSTISYRWKSRINFMLHLMLVVLLNFFFRQETTLLLYADKQIEL